MVPVVKSKNKKFFSFYFFLNLRDSTDFFINCVVVNVLVTYFPITSVFVEKCCSFFFQLKRFVILREGLYIPGLSVINKMSQIFFTM